MENNINTQNRKIFDVLIVITLKDFIRVQNQYTRLVKYFSKMENVGKIYFVGAEDVKNQLIQCDFYKQFPGKTDFINENDIIPFDDVHKVMTERLNIIFPNKEIPRGVTGWYYQQFLKMQYAYMCENEYYMTWDGDTIACGPFSVFKDDTEIPFIDMKVEYHKEYFDTMEVLIPGMRKCVSKSFISEHMLFRVDLMKKLIDSIMSNGNIAGNVFYEKILNAISPEKIQSSSFSEFETYGTFVCLNEPSAYRMREWHSFRLAGEFFDINTISDNDYNWLSQDFSAISFEKGHFVRDDHKNLFDNPEYQKKLSPRQMLEAAQEEFQDGYLEVWDDANSINSSNSNSSAAENVIDYQFMYYNNLGDYYENINVDKAYLAYEQAVYVCKDDNFKAAIKNKMLALKSNKAVSVNKTAIVIVSYNSQYLMEKCLESIRNTTSKEMVDIIVVDNASSDGVTEYLEKQSDIILIKNAENVGFPKGCNIGIEAAKNNQDIFLLNNDTRLVQNSLFWLRMGLYENEKIGAVGAVSNYCGDDQRLNINFKSVEEYIKYGEEINIAMDNPYEEKNRLCGFAMLMKREAFDLIGKLDEMFSPGYFEDDDISIGIHSLGYRLNVCHNAFIYHAGSQSFIKRNDLNDIMDRNLNYISNKWGYKVLENSVVTESEANTIKKINHSRYDTFRLLEIGAGSGNLLTRVKCAYPNAEIYGVETDEGAIWNGVHSLPILKVDWHNEKLPFPEEYFDYIIYYDRFGKGIDREEVENKLNKYLSVEGQIIF